MASASAARLLRVRHFAAGRRICAGVPAEIEASIYHQSKVPDANIYPEIASIAQPVTVIRAGRARRPGVFDLSTSPTAENLASYFAESRDKVFEDCTHYIPQEAPARVTEEIALLLVE